VAGPVIKSIVAPTPAMAQSGKCKQSGESCNSPPDCCSNVCCTTETSGGQAVCVGSIQDCIEP